jgi:hypothetical protein
MPMVCDAWPVDTSCLPQGWPAEPTEWNPEQKAAVDVASEILKRLSGGVFGLCTLKIRPCRTRYREPWPDPAMLGVGTVAGGPWSPTLLDGRIYNFHFGCGGDSSCGCSPMSEITLDPPAYDVVQVKVDGLVLPASAYRVDDTRKLVRVDGLDWPDCQEMARSDTEPGTWSVVYRTGTPVPPGGRMAVALLAAQLWKACGGNRGKCALPERVTEVIRDGVTYTLLDNLETFERGRTGLSRVDLWLASVNPYAARAPMRAWSPDTIRHRQVTFPTETLPGTGPGGGAGGSFVFTQNIPIDVWTIEHPLGFYPAGVQVRDSLGQEIVGEITYPSINVVRIDFGAPTSGVAYLS